MTNEDVNIVEEVRELVLTTAGSGIQSALSSNSNIEVTSTVKTCTLEQRRSHF